MAAGRKKALALNICPIAIAAWDRLQDTQLSQRDRAAGCVIVFAKSRRLELGDKTLRTL